MPRSLANYKADQGTNIAGKAPKWVLRGPGDEDDFFIAKFGASNGYIEVFTELLNNQLSGALGLDMAHSGIASLDGHTYFITRNFRRKEQLIHGSLLVAEILSESETEIAKISHKHEQAFYSLDFVMGALDRYCGLSAQNVKQAFVEMLIFDALIGSQDRHPSNWGVLRAEQAHDGRPIRLAPIYDSARALLWNSPEADLLKFDGDQSWRTRYIMRAKPCIGGHSGHERANDYNHFEMAALLYKEYSHLTDKIMCRIADLDLWDVATRILGDFPFEWGFSALRKRVVLKVLMERYRLLLDAAGKGGRHEEVALELENKLPTATH